MQDTYSSNDTPEVLLLKNPLKNTTALTEVMPVGVNLQSAPVGSTLVGVKLIDSDETAGLELYCYSNCTNADSDEIKQCRGIVKSGDTLVMKTFPYADEYNHTQLAELKEFFPTGLQEWNITESHEGTLLRMFFFSGRWYLSTHRKLSAFKSKWGSKESFGTLFVHALQNEFDRSEDFVCDGDVSVLNSFQETLNKSYVYTFLLRSNADTRIVSNPPAEGEPSVYHVGTFLSDGTMLPEVRCGLPKPGGIRFSNLESLLDYISKMDYRKLQGVVCINQFPSGLRVVKILNKTYQDRAKLRGNEPSVKFRYLQVRMFKDMVKGLSELYPDCVPVFEKYEDILFRIAKNVYSNYVQRYIKKIRLPQLPREDFIVLKDCHSWHLLNRDTNKIHFNKVVEILNKQPPTNLNRMIRRYNCEIPDSGFLHVRSYPNSVQNSPNIIANINENILIRIPALQ